MMRARLWFYGIVLLVIAGFAIVAIPAATSVTNCGRNSAALTDCGSFANLMVALADDKPNQPFLITNVPPEYREEFSRLARPDHWIPKAHFFVSTQPLVGTALDAQRDRKNRRILIVCDTPYTNVPERQFWHAPPTHAVGYSDGTTGLISPAEFAKLDFSTFKRLDELFPPEPAR